MVSSARIDMTASVFMGSMVGFECGQKRLRLAHFQDQAGELVGSLPPAHVRLHRHGRNFINRYRRIAPKRAMPNDVGIVACGGSRTNTGTARYPAAGRR